MLDAAIYICAALVLVGCICLGYLGVGGGFHNQRMLALVITYITLFFVLTGAFLYFYQKLRDDQRSDRNRATSNGGRAWITVQSAGFVSLKVGEPVRVKAVFVNSGETPAYNLVTGGRVEVKYADHPVPNPMPVEEINFNEGVGVLGANGNTYELAGDVGVPLNEATLALINQGRMRVYMWGMIKYDDVAKNSHWLKFCFFNFGAKGFSPCPNNNEGT